MSEKPTTTSSVVPSAGIYRTRDLVALGISRTQVRRLVDRGALVCLGRGLYSTHNTPVTEKHTIAEVCKRVPRGIICLTSALQFHNLTTQNPWQVCLSLPPGYHAPRMDYPALWIFRARGEALTEGIAIEDIEGVPVHVTVVARTVADCFKYRNRIGLDIALEALRESLKTGQATVGDLHRYARMCRVENVIRPYIEAMLEALAV